MAGDRDSAIGFSNVVTGIKENIRKKHGFNQAKNLLTFEDGLAEKQSTCLVTARPILAALSPLDQMGEMDEGSSASDVDVIKRLLENALNFLANVNVRLNYWRQCRFSEYLTEAGRLTYQGLRIYTLASFSRVVQRAYQK